MSARTQRGIALVSVLLIMVLMVGLLTGFYAVVVADQNASGITRDQTQAYAAAHAGLEKLTADLGRLFTGGNYSPSADDLAALEGAPPDFTGFAFESPDGSSGYRLQQRAVQTAPIAAGPYQGLVGLITPYEVTVTARTDGGAETRMRREVQTIAVPVFQFGIYSENDLSFFAGPNFSFGGRVHTNQNIYLAQQGETLTLQDRVTAVGEVVRSHLANGVPITTSGHTGTVRMARASGCPAAPTAANAACRNLAATRRAASTSSATRFLPARRPSMRMARQ